MSIEFLTKLRELGVTKAKFSTEGQLISVTFGHPSTEVHESPAENLEEQLTGPWDRVLNGGDVS